MKSLVELLENLILDCMRKSGAPLSRDVVTLRDRVKHEGDSFITITLPAFCADFEKSLALGRVAPGSWLSFGKLKAGIPAFLQGLLCRVFDMEGNLLTDPSTDCIRLVRQICLFGKKILRQCSDERLQDAVERYCQCEDDVREHFGGDTLLGVYEAVAEVILSSFPTLHADNFVGELLPKHGPGATQERIMGNQKWRFRRWHSRLENVGFEYLKFGRAQATRAMSLDGRPLYEDSEGNFSDIGEPMPEVIDPENEPPVRVVFVPKTLKTPRVIAVEPVCMQYAQQALAKLLVGLVETGPLTAGHVNFTDQTINQGLAEEASRGGTFATLDMSDASDRVSKTHVYALLDTVPQLRNWVFACRSESAILPSGEKIRLEKFASMGSALCFPMESLVFFTSIIASRLSRAGIPPTWHSVKKYGRDVYVYGDDLIVPADEAPAICDDLEALGFKVNRRKSFWTGKFRESCGADCYNGERVTPVYLRSDVPTDRTDVSGILSTVSTANQLYSAGYWKTASALRKAVERLVGRLPQVSDEDVKSLDEAVKQRHRLAEVDTPAIGWNAYSEASPPLRWNFDLQRRERRHLVVVPSRAADPIDGDAALAKCFRLIGSEDPIDPEHLDVSVRPYGLTLKRRWVPVNK
uniref:RNA-directed RNA polymerase n=1 Tax=Leviviridae sp. TaxID=2027243 RepID=A0A514D4V3_9VIRU|nr:MAG: RNA-dependent RNA polymerase [Leviviridae sp.]